MMRSMNFDAPSNQQPLPPVSVVVGGFALNLEIKHFFIRSLWILFFNIYTW